MKQHKYTIHPRRFWFSNWTRKSWAVFNSLKVVVHNILTRFASFKDTLLKQPGANRNEIIQQIKEIGTLDELREEPVSSWFEILTTRLLLLINLSTTKQIKYSSIGVLANIYHSLPDKFRDLLGRDFLFIQYEAENY